MLRARGKYLYCFSNIYNKHPVILHLAPSQPAVGGAVNFGCNPGLADYGALIS
jgi:hypothetical protein